MAKNNSALKITYVVASIIAIFVVITGTVTAWYCSNIGINANTNLASSSAAYFASGDGSESHPYEINQARHVYNLAWLQDLGYFDDADPNTEGVQRYYFIITNDIDMSDLKYDGIHQNPIPPIGIESHPFISDLDGGNHTINNLLIDTYYNNSSYIKPSSDVLALHTETYSDYMVKLTYLGVFGYVGPLITPTNTAADKNQNVSNIYFDNTVINSNARTTKFKSVGVIAGYVNANVNTIGVHNSTLYINSSAFSSSTTISKYGLVGDYNNDLTGGIEWEEGIEGDQRGEQGYGASTDIAAVYNSIRTSFPNLTHGNDNSGDNVALGGSMCFPFVMTSGTKVSSSGSLNGVTYASTCQAGSKNLGYFCGSTVSDKKDTSPVSLVKYDNTKTIVPTTYYWANTNNSTHPTLPIYDTDGTTVLHAAPTTQMLNFLGEGTSYNSSRKNISYFVQIRDVNLGNITAQPSNYQWAIKNAVIDGTVMDIIVPRECIWVYAKKDGYFSFICGGSSNSEGFQVNRVGRSTSGDLSSTITSFTQVANYPYLNANTYYYYQIPVEAGNDYIITGVNSMSFSVYYLDVGQAGGGGTPAYNARIEGLDFVAYSGENGYTSPNTNNSDVLIRLNTADIQTDSTLIINRKTIEKTSVYYNLTGNTAIKNIGAMNALATTSDNVFTTR